jgi:hypothetical protein
MITIYIAVCHLAHYDLALGLRELVVGEGPNQQGQFKTMD